MKKEVLGVKIDDINMEESLEIVENWLSKENKHYIVTPNPEFIVAAQKDKLFQSILNNADLSIADGVGLKLSGKVKNIIPGIDLMEQLVKMAADCGFTTGFLGGREEIAKKVGECLKKKYPKLKVSFAESGGEVSQDGQSQNIKIPATDLLFVAFGPVKQEKWIANNLEKIPVKIAMGVGGSFDYLSGQIPRAPAWVRNLGFEWLFRLIVEPIRIKRQLALIKYLLMIL